MPARSLWVVISALVWLRAAAAQTAVDVLISADTSMYARSLDGLQSSIDAPIQIQYLDAIEEKYGDLTAYFRSAQGNDRKLIITVGPVATKQALDQATALPVLFSMIDSPRTLDSRRKSCGLSLHISLAEYFRVLKEIKPDAQSVVAFYSTEQSAFLLGEGDYLDLKHGLRFQKVKTTRSALISRIKDQEKVDAIFVAADPIYDRSNFEFLSDFAKKNRIVLMTGFASLVRSGATFAVTADYGRLGALTGEMANRMLKGSSCQREGVRFTDQTAFYLNEEYARASGLKIPENLKERARMTGLFHAGLNLYRDGRYKSAQIVFDRILADDPRNESALLYRARVVEQLTGARTGQLLGSAQEHFKRGAYERAIADYRAVLKVHERNREALRGLDAARAALSEQQRGRAQAIAGGDPFGAIRLLQQAVLTNPENQRAAGELSQLRAIQAARLPALLAEAEGHYTSRHYTEAIALYENILLIAPGHKEASEYLRLSQRKRAAIEELLQRQ
ncbi:MAG: peptide ABC transporter substrate-binding protein [Spirochaetales bacterium]|nr:peptide ABC transporter substrate-binding protein [Spirochaetales bacterium]